MKDSPILFSGPMVRAILEGRKTQTRRVIRPKPKRGNEFGYNPLVGMWCEFDPRQQEIIEKQNCPYGFPGDRLWVKETWGQFPNPDIGELVAIYVADWIGLGADFPVAKRPSIFMPRWASRLTLEITAIRAERLQAISEDEALAEGVEMVEHNSFQNYMADADWEFRGKNERGYLFYKDPIGSFASLWDSINLKHGLGWATNPWVWVVEFRKV